jgi:hypothetical protein
MYYFVVASLFFTEIVDMCVPTIEISDTLLTFVNDEQNMDGNSCLFIIFTVLMVAIKRI